jgi:hypothetical protein
MPRALCFCKAEEFWLVFLIHQVLLAEAQEPELALPDLRLMYALIT